MNNDTLGEATDILASYLDIEREAVALQLIAAVNSIAGRRGCIEGMASELVHPEINTIIVDNDANPAQDELSRIVHENLIVMQRHFKDVSGAPCRHSVQTLAWMKMKGDRIARAGKIFDADPREAIETSEELAHESRCYHALTQPTFLLKDPTPEAINKALEESLDRRLAVIDTQGSILNNASSKRPQKAQKNMVEMISASMDEQSQYEAHLEPQERRSERVFGFGKIEIAKVNLHMTLPEDIIAQALNSKNRHVHNILTNSLIIPVQGLDDKHRINLRVDMPTIAHTRFRNAIEAVATARRYGNGIQLALEESVIVQLFEHRAKLSQWHQALPEKLRSFFPGLYRLPLQLLWGLSIIEKANRYQSSVSVEQLMSIATRLTDWAIEKKANIITGLMDVVERGSQEFLHEQMLQKIHAKQPVSFTDLKRSYSSQANHIHQPVLDALIESGLVAYTDDKLLVATVTNPKQRIS